MINPIYPCLWFDGQAKEAAEFYGAAFNDSSIKSENPMVVIFELEGKKLMGLNGGPMFTINPSISMFVTCASDDEIELLWSTLSDGGSALMALDQYPWSEKYGWVKDRYGMTWQVMKGAPQVSGPKIVPAMLFTNDQYGKAEEAIRFYTSIFPNSNILSLSRYETGESQPEGNLKFGRFELNQEVFIAMDGPGSHEFVFNEALSYVVECESQADIDYYWNALTAAGGQESMCGWLKDKFGVSWQIVPAILGKLMSDPERGQRVMQVVLQSKKMDLDRLMNA